MDGNSQWIEGSDEDSVKGFYLNDRKLTAFRLAYEETGILLSTPYWKEEVDPSPFYEFWLTKQANLKPEDLHFFSWHIAPPGIPNLFDWAFFFHNLPNPDTPLNVNP